MPVQETYTLPSKAVLEVETYSNSEGLTGLVGHWGDKLPMDTVHQRLAQQGVPEADLSNTTGFDFIYHQADNLPRQEGIKDELAVAEIITRATMEANHWGTTDVDALFLGSGVPVTDDESLDANYAREIAKRIGMRDDVKTHSTYAACTSGAHEFFRALSDPELQNKNVVVLGMEGITTLTQNLDIANADPFSIQVFSNGAAGIGMVPGQDVVLHSVKHRVFEDTDGVLAARMTHERLVDPENQDIWQENDTSGVHLIKYPKPEGERQLTLSDRTAMFFISHMLPFIEEIYREHYDEHPAEEIIYVASHHASEPVHKGISKRLGRKKIENLDIPWVIRLGNSSGASPLIAHNMLLERSVAGKHVMVTGYGAGGSADGGIIEYRSRGA